MGGIHLFLLPFFRTRPLTKNTTPLFFVALHLWMSNGIEGLVSGCPHNIYFTPTQIYSKPTVHLFLICIYQSLLSIITQTNTDSIVMT